jgi:alpha-ketoglutarate-dependent taurine dioxygenase
MVTTLPLPPDLSVTLARQTARLNPQRPTRDVTFSPELFELRQQILSVVDADGLAVITNLSGDPDRTLFGLMSLVGVPARDENAGPMVMDLKPVPHEMTKETTSYYSWNEFDYHTDLSHVDAPPDLIIVLCVTPDARGEGRSIFADVRAAAPELSAAALEALQKPQFVFRAPPHYRSGRAARLPILSRNAQGEWQIRVRFDRTTAETPEAEGALQELSAALDKHRLELLLDKNTAYIVDNLRVAHGRTPFTPTFSEGDRHLKRILGVRRSP